MGRHRTAEEKKALREEVLRLRDAGVTRREMRERLGLSPYLLHALLSTTGVVDGRYRARALDELRPAAHALRRGGATYAQIAEDLGVSRSTLSLWLGGTGAGDAAAPTPRPGAAADQAVRDRARSMRREGSTIVAIAAAVGVSTTAVYRWTHDLPVPARAQGRSAEECRQMQRARWDRVLAERDAERNAVRDAATAEVGVLTERELLLVGAVAYWCEGAKSKPWQRREKLSFINSDVDVIRLFMAYLRLLAVPLEQVRFRLSIHETADVAAAERFWADVVGVPVDRFSRASLKRHNPKTVRHNTGEGYHGCLVVVVLQSRTLYQRTEGLWRGIMAGVEAG